MACFRSSVGIEGSRGLAGGTKGRSHAQKRNQPRSTQMAQSRSCGDAEAKSANLRLRKSAASRSWVCGQSRAGDASRSGCRSLHQLSQPRCFAAGLVAVNHLALGGTPEGGLQGGKHLLSILGLAVRDSLAILAFQFLKSFLDGTVSVAAPECHACLFCCRSSISHTKKSLDSTHFWR